MAQKSTNAASPQDQSNSATPVAGNTSDAAAQSPAASPSADTKMSDPVPSGKPDLKEVDDALKKLPSEPMSKSASSTSDQPSTAKDAALAAADSASPYGTRSRNRGGTSRPNYAEDKDVDMEMYEDYSEQAEQSKKSSSRNAGHSASSTAMTPSAQDSTRTNGTSRKNGTSDEGKANSAIGSGSNNGGSSTATTTAASNSKNSGHSKDKEQSASQAASAKDATGSHSGSGQSAAASSGSHAAAQPSSKKRKAAAQASASASQSHTPAPTSSSATATASSRRPTTNSAGDAPTTPPASNMLTFENTKGILKDGALIADDSTSLKPNDNVYLVCEPPGEPYYLGRIMEFLHPKNDTSKPVDALRINWFYRPRDIAKKVTDTRLVFATMHSDISPLTSLRGKCQIRHKAQIPRMDEYRKTPDSFWYEKLYDRYIQKNYDLIPTSLIVNVPEKVKKVLDDRWDFIIVEQGRGKEFTSAVKSCKRCSAYCASNDSVDCAVCKNTYHMNCVRPPLLKKPSRGFAWSCAACSRAQERKLEARHTPNLTNHHGEGEDDDMYDDEDEEMQCLDTERTSPENDDDGAHRVGTAEQIHHASLWPWRYLGMHCKPEDALDYDDRIYPRASTRIGPRHQATVLPWPGRPVEYLPPLEYKRPAKKDPRAKEIQAAYEAEKARREQLPKYMQEQPPGYIVRGEDFEDDDQEPTAELLWKAPMGENGRIKPDAEGKLDDYMKQAIKLASKFDLEDASTNLRDIAIQAYYNADYDTEAALKILSETKKANFKEPDLSPAELKKFEEAVGKYGSELSAVTRHVKTVPFGSIVRFYYVWKKTKQGKQIWGNHSNRKGKKEAKKAELAASKLQDDVADDADDSAFDTDKASDKKKGFICKFCNTKSSRQWRRAPNVTSAMLTEGASKAAQKDKSQYIQALCRRCAELWRRYAIQWEDLEEMVKKVAQAGRAWKRKQDEELLKELHLVQELHSRYGTPEPAPTPAETVAPVTNGTSAGGEPPRKKLKASADKDTDKDNGASDPVTATATAPKKKEKLEKAAPPPAPEIPKPRTMPCAVCGEIEPLGDQHLSCKDCRMTVHRNCYGVSDHRSASKWTCDMCSNDKNPQVSIQYKCVLCPIEHTEHDFVGPPTKTSSSKKKSEKDKEREKTEREQAQKTADYYKKKQEDTGRPANPREPLKRTADNNWVHVTCAIWTPEVKFGNPRALAASEGIPSIPRARYDEVCTACGHKGGACVACQQCKAPVHVECARQHDYLLGFDIAPVKGSRREQHNIVTINGESGAMSATVWCKDHYPTKTIVHRMHDVVNDNGQNALQLYAQQCKQADLTLTGTVRKANLIANAAKTPATAAITASARRASTTTAPVNGVKEISPSHSNTGEKICITCGCDVSPRWYAADDADERELTNGHHGTLGLEAKKFIEQRKFQCHKCRKARRKPKPYHVVKEESPVKESMTSAAPTPMPLAPPAQLAPPPLKSPPTMSAAEPPRSNLSYPWAASGPAGNGGPLHAPAPATAPVPAPAPVTPTAAPVQAPAAPAHHVPPMPPRDSPSLPYGSQAPRYGDWHSRPPTQHGSPPRQVNGGPPPIPQPGLGNLSALRPPPMSLPPGPPMQHGHPPPVMAPTGHHGPGMHGSLPPSPRHSEPPPPPMGHSSPYIHPYHTHAPPPPPPPPSRPMPNGGPPPSRGPDAFSQGLLPQRPPYPGHHGSPPAGREPLRDGPGPLSAPSMRPQDPPPPPPRPAGASTSPSLRNLLS